MKKNMYWWIEGKHGLITYGRNIQNNVLWDSYVPNLFALKRDAAEHCRPGEKPVKVKLVKI